MIAVKKALKENKKVYQLSGNNNKIINDNISLTDNYIKTIDDAISYNKNIENKKMLKLNNKNNNEQISLF